MTGRMAVAVLVTAVLAVGCGSAAQPTTSQPAISEPAEHHAQSTSQPAAAQGETISVRISEGKVEGVPARVEVDRGSQVRIEVTSDRVDELHVHGYDKTVALPAGSPAAVAFVADLPGVFEVETHESELLLFQLVVRG